MERRRPWPGHCHVRGIPLTAVLWTRQCAEWTSKYASDVDLPLTCAMPGLDSRPEAKERTRAMLADLSDADPTTRRLCAGIIGVILGIDRDFERIFAECVSQNNLSHETPIPNETAGTPIVSAGSA